METIQNSSNDSPQKPPRKRSRKLPPTLAELQQQYETAKQQLRIARATERQEHIARMGYLAHAAGLAQYNSATLQEAFAALAIRLATASEGEVSHAE